MTWTNFYRLPLPIRRYYGMVNRQSIEPVEVRTRSAVPARRTQLREDGRVWMFDQANICVSTSSVALHGGRPALLASSARRISLVATGAARERGAKAAPVPTARKTVLVSGRFLTSAENGLASDQFGFSPRSYYISFCSVHVSAINCVICHGARVSASSGRYNNSQPNSICANHAQGTED